MIQNEVNTIIKTRTEKFLKVSFYSLEMLFENDWRHSKFISLKYNVVHYKYSGQLQLKIYIPKSFWNTQAQVNEQSLRKS